MKANEFARRRRQLMRMMDNDSIVILPSARTQIRNRDVEYDFRQNSDFLYLTGYNEPDSLLVLMPGRSQGQFVLFCRERDMQMEIWNGRRSGQEGAIENFGADDAFPISDIDEILPGLLEHRERVYYTMGRNVEFDQRLIGWVNLIREKSRSGSLPPQEFVSLEYLLHDMRLYKSRDEQSAMKKAAKVSVAAHQRAMRLCRPGMYEYQIEAEIQHEFRSNNMVTAYPTIVGGGENGCILHYTENTSVLNDGELLLIDAGAENEGYASDITRTFPINGKFGSAQRELYELVLEAQLAAIDKVKPGNHWNDAHVAAVKVLTKGLVSLGLLKGKPAQLIKDGKYRRFFMHRTGHWLGMDVHDVGDYQIDEKWRLLEPGMTLTVEPGLYIAGGSKGIAKKWWDIGIRIEDDVLVTSSGNQVLTDALVKRPDDIEAFMATGCN